MGKSKQTTDDSFAQNWYEWASDITGATGHAIRVVLVTTPRRNVWRVRVEAVAVVDNKAVRVECCQSALWPNEKADGLYATVYQLMLAVDRMLAEKAQEGEAQAG